MRVVVDTNVIVSGMLSADTPPARIVEWLFSGELIPVYDDRILAEYAAVLARPQFGFDQADVAWFFDVLRYGESVVPLPLPLRLPDASDLKFIEVAVAGGVDAIVTGNTRHFAVSNGKLAVPVVTPRRMIERMRRG